MDVEKLNSYFISIFFTYIYFQKMLDGFHDNSFLHANVRCQKTVGVGWGAVHLAPPKKCHVPVVHANSTESTSTLTVLFYL